MLTADLIHGLVPRLATRLALVDRDGQRTWTFAQLDRAVARVAAALRRAGVGRGQAVAVVSPNRAEVILLWLACQRLSAIFAPLDPRATPWELRRRLSLVEPSLVVVAADAASRVAEACEAAGLPARRVVFDQAGRDGYDAWRAAASRPLGGSEADAGAIGVVLFTSGSTATPRGARLPQRMLATNAFVTAAAWDLRPDDRALVTSPLWHAGGLGAFPLATWAAGGSVVIASRFHAESYWDDLLALGITATFGVPTSWQRAARAHDFGRPTGLRLPLIGGAPAPARLLIAYRQAGLPLRQGFGMTEAGINLLTATPEQARDGLPGVGWPLPGVEVAVLAPDGRPCPDDVEGDLVIGGPFVAEGYVGAPDETAAVFEGGRVRTGDLVVRRAHGFEVVGRRAQTYTTNGYLVSGAEVELALHDVADLEAVAVVAVPDAEVGEVSVAFVVPGRRDADGTASLLSRLRARLSRYKWPVAIVERDALPEASSGKIDRERLRVEAVDIARERIR